MESDDCSDNNQCSSESQCHDRNNGDISINPNILSTHGPAENESSNEIVDFTMPSTVIDEVISVKTTKAHSDYLHNLAFYGALFIASYFGGYIRFGFLYYRIWNTETNYSGMYFQIIGCVIMGYTLEHKVYLYDATNVRTRRIIYTAITTGLCGSITSFGYWSMECNKNFFLQWDTSWGNVLGSYNGGRLLEWLVCMWAGVVVPLAALKLGKYLGSYSPYSNKSCTNAVIEHASEQSNGNSLLFDTDIPQLVCIVASFLATTLLIAVLPATDFPTWILVTYTALLGGVGAFLRYQVSFVLNPQYKNFPLGTFTVNVVGTCLLAVVTLLSNLYVDYNNLQIQALLGGLRYGFCGCLTTVSTFVNEIDSLPLTDSYIYSISTNAMAQFVIVLIWNIAAYKSVPLAAVRPKVINFCTAHRQLCGRLLDRIACPAQLQINHACTDEAPNYSTYEGLCSCGHFQTQRVAKELIDSQVKYAILRDLVAVWPTAPGDDSACTETIDMCLTYNNACDDFLERIGCPAHERSVSGCGHKNIENFKGLCSCGAIGVSSIRIKELIIDAVLRRRYDLLPYQGYITQGSIDFNEAFEQTCNKLLRHIQCPGAHALSMGNTAAGNYSTWRGVCSCSAFDASARVAVAVYDGLLRPYLASLMSPFPKISNITNITNSTNSTNIYSALPVKPSSWDMCASYVAICTTFLDLMGCQPGLRQVQACEGTSFPTHVHGKIEHFKNICACGSLRTLNSRNYEMVVDALLMQDIDAEYTYIPAATAAYSTVMGSSPFKQLRYPAAVAPDFIV